MTHTAASHRGRNQGTNVASLSGKLYANELLTLATWLEFKNEYQPSHLS